LIKQGKQKDSSPMRSRRKPNDG